MVWLLSALLSTLALVPSGTAPAWPVSFVDVAARAGLTRPSVYGGLRQKRFIIETNGAGVALFDADGDGWVDALVLNGTRLKEVSREEEAWTPGQAPVSHLYRNNADGTFSDVTEAAGLRKTGWASSVCVGDYDNDGRLDLFVVNGHTNQLRDDPTHLVPMRDQLFWNRSSQEGFFEVSSVSGAYFEQALVGRGAAFADYDNDGDLDAFVVNSGGPAVLLRNEGGNRGRWLQVEVQGTRSNRQGIGATIRVVAGGRAQIRQVGAQSSYLSQNSLIEHFGLGALTTVDTIEVRWPSGGHQIRTGIPSMQRLLMVEDRPK